MTIAKSKKEKYPSYDDFLDSVKDKNYRPIYLFIGTEDFLIDECVAGIIKDLLTEDIKSFNLDIVYGSKTEAKEVIAHAASYPMMSERRIVVVKEFDKLFSGETAKEIVANYIAKPLETTCLIMITESPDFRTKPFYDLKKMNVVYAFNSLYDNQVPSWIANRCKRAGKTADIEACRLIHAYVGNSLRAIQNELDKLFTYIGERKQITPEDIADVIGVTRGYTVFDLQNAIGKKHIDQSLKIVKRMIETGETPQLTIIMLTRYFNLLWKIQDLLKQGKSEPEIVSATRLSPYYIKDYLEAARRFSSSQIENAFSALLESDIKLKTTSPDHYHLMEMLVFSLIRDHQPAEIN